MKHIKNLGFLLYVARSAEELERLSGKLTESVNSFLSNPGLEFLHLTPEIADTAAALSTVSYENFPRR
jgi:hypothetical protein